MKKGGVKIKEASDKKLLLKNATFDRKKSFGFRKVWINGTTVLDGDASDEKAIKSSGKSITA